MIIVILKETQHFLLWARPVSQGAHDQR